VTKPNVRPKGRAIKAIGRVLWLIILAPVLGVSAYSMFFVARHLGAPPPVAACFSACLDGVALLAANYSLRYAQEGLSGALPRTVVWVVALLGALIQTLHVTLGDEPRLAALFWASLPISAVVVYEMHMRWERRVALARVGVTHPTPLPSFGFITWLLFPLSTLSALEAIVLRRRAAIAEAFAKRPALANLTEDEPSKVLRADVIDRPKANVRPIGSAPNAAKGRATKYHAPKAHIRSWAKAQGLPVGDRARIPVWIEQKYDEAHRQAGNE
jgi:hypothetical protein